MGTLIWQGGNLAQSQSVPERHKLPNLFFDTIAKFHASVLIRGGVKADTAANAALKAIRASAATLVGTTWHQDEGENLNGARLFQAQLLLGQPEFPVDLELQFDFESTASIRIKVQDIQRSLEPAASKVAAQFQDYLRLPTTRKVLDIGGRARSGVLRANAMKDKDVTVLDILLDEGVDVVADAHRLSSVLPASSFDAVTSIAVFEHLAMPWKVAIEMNRVMKPGALAFIHTHQTIGMHDLPWDYFRFSDSAWKGIFNEHTGFKIIGTELSHPQYIIPFVWSSQYKDVEKTAGYETSLVCVQKIGDTNMDWPLGVSDVTRDMYPAR